MGIMEALANVSQHDIDEIDSRLLTIDAEIAAIVHPLQEERQKLVNAKAVICKLLGTTPTSGLAKTVADYVRERGTVSRDEVLRHFRWTQESLRGASQAINRLGITYDKNTREFSVRKSSDTKDSAGGGSEDKMTLEKCRNLAFDLITNEGSLPTSVIASRLKLSPLFVGRAVNHEWFVKQPDGDINIAR